MVFELLSLPFHDMYVIFKSILESRDFSMFSFGHNTNTQYFNS